jgi:hypothetical protein
VGWVNVLCPSHSNNLSLWISASLWPIFRHHSVSYLVEKLLCGCFGFNLLRSWKVLLLLTPSSGYFFPKKVFLKPMYIKLILFPLTRGSGSKRKERLMLT